MVFWVQGSSTQVVRWQCACSFVSAALTTQHVAPSGHSPLRAPSACQPSLTCHHDSLQCCPQPKSQARQNNCKPQRCAPYPECPQAAVQVKCRRLRCSEATRPASGTVLCMATWWPLPVRTALAGTALSALAETPTCVHPGLVDCRGLREYSQIWGSLCLGLGGCFWV